MNKKILILEPTETIRSFFTEKLKAANLDISFESDGIQFFSKVLSSKPDAILLNAKCQNPKTIYLVRLIKDTEELQKIPVGLYATSDFTFERRYAENSGCDAFIRFRGESLAEDVGKLLSLADKQLSARPEQGFFFKSVMTERILSLSDKMESLTDIIQEFLNMIAETLETPAASLLLKENDGTYAYYVASKKFTQEEIKDFLKVCTSDFEQTGPDVNVSQIVPMRLASSKNLEKFRTNELPLSSYRSVKLKCDGTLNVVKEKNFSSRQIDVLEFSADKINVLIENALMLKKKIFFEKRIRKAFSRFVPEQIIDELVTAADDSDKVAVGEKREVAILFSDIRSFTSISERNTPETIVAFLNRYFTTMVNIIKKHGGTIDKFIGDAIMAEFGCPVSYEDNSRRAVEAAYEMREALPSVPLEDLILPEGMKFNIGIGIHYGDVTVGSIGSSDKTDYTVIGDSVNLASRLEGLTKTYGSMIVVSDSVKEDIKDDNAFVFRYLDDVKVKGKAKAVPIYAVDRSEEEFSAEYRDNYSKGLDLYKQGVFNLAKEYFEKALTQVPDDKAALLMQERCAEFIKNPPVNWDGAITFHTK